MTIKMIRLDGQLDPSKRAFAFFDEKAGNFCGLDVGDDHDVQTWQSLHALESDCERAAIADRDLRPPSKYHVEATERWRQLRKERHARMLELARAELSRVQPREREIVADIVKRLAVIGDALTMVDPRVWQTPAIQLGTQRDTIVAAGVLLRKMASLDEESRSPTPILQWLDEVHRDGPSRAEALLEVHRAYAAITIEPISDPSRLEMAAQYAPSMLLRMQQADVLVKAVGELRSSGTDVWLVESLQRALKTLDEWMVTFDSACKWIAENEARKGLSRCSWCNEQSIEAGDAMRTHALKCDHNPVVLRLRKLQHDVAEIVNGTKTMPPNLGASLLTCVDESNGLSTTRKDD